MSETISECHEAAKLKARHAQLDNALHAEENKPLPDPLALASLKKKKLHLKDELARLESV